ncbi:MAG: cobyrinate a,c-diamide synthase, partial [Proteobacteria bacterium]|nr:cobyrinate a,c-diamide synthase [Pseudomonadota bacterium]
MRIRGLIISAVKSGSGKTIASLSVMNLLKEAGYDVIPFKTGPDFIDTSHYKYVCGLDGRNLDTFFMKKSFILWNIMDAIKEMKAKNPFIVIEGAMGLFDGYGEKGAGSTAELAKLLNLPVVLVVDAKGMGQSVSALVAGFKGWDRKVNIAGILLNNVGSEKHFDLLKKSLEKTDARPIGYIKRDESLSIPSRHLGISMGYERDKKLDDALKSAKEGLDKKKIEDISEELNLGGEIKISLKWSKKRIYIAFDEAFCFCYKENIRLLSEAGDVRFFSPLMDKSLDLPDFIYLPGGYPELFADKLSENKNMMGYIKDYVKNGG